MTSTESATVESQASLIRRLVPVGDYRRDIDGLRAMAVLAVIAFHSGFLPKGYLGVDVFFVISGYLITKIIYNDCRKGRFSVVNFYLRRIRRIIPLILTVNASVLAVGMLVMLPDDLENLCESVVATNASSNNILQWLTTSNYWDVVNEYKPLLHTWSLGVEEQYYLLYPILFLILNRVGLRWLHVVLVGLTVGSIALYVSPFHQATVFYMLPFRFFELSLGGLAAVCLDGRVIRHSFSFPLVALLIALLVGIPGIGPRWALVVTVMVTLGILVSDNTASRISAWILQNKAAVGIGLISYSLYMWHQPVLSFARYFVFEHIGGKELLLLAALMVGLSIFSYFLVERPFRDKNRISTRVLLGLVSVVFLTTSAVALGTFFRAGVIRDVPELDLTVGHAERGMHAKYNWRILDYDRDFCSTDKIKILILGNSFSRDWANVLLESKYKEAIELSYLSEVEAAPASARARLASADVVFMSLVGRESVAQLGEKFGADPSRIWMIGFKSFGASNGIFYNFRGKDYYEQRTPIDPGEWSANVWGKETWGERFIDLMEKVVDQKGKIPIFTPDHRFISQDCRHFTRAGAQYFASLVGGDLERIIGGAVKARKAPGWTTTS